MSSTNSQAQEKFVENHIFNVLNVKTKTDQILVFGHDDKLMKTLNKTSCHVSKTSKEKDLNSWILDEVMFDKVIVVDGFFVPEPGIFKKLAQLVHSTGLITFLNVDANNKELYNSLLEELYPRSDVWEFNSNLGVALVSNANGVPQFS